MWKLIGIFLISFQVLAEDIYDLSLDELMDIPVSIVTKAPVSRREAPGITSVITAEQIRASGARNFMDILNLVPGFQLSGDWYNTGGIGFRGLLALEGKMLLMIDGLDMTEMYYDDLIYHYQVPVDHVERVEIIRGPGSVVYGGSAEYAVINVITRSAKQIAGSRTNLGIGFTEKGLVRQSLSQELGASFGSSQDWQLTAKLFASELTPTDRTRDYPLGGSVEMFETTDFKNYHLNLGLVRQGLSVKVLIDEHKTYGNEFSPSQASATQVREDFDYHNVQVKYDWKLADFTISPEYNYKQTQSYYTPETQTVIYPDGTVDLTRRGGYTIDRNQVILPIRWDVTPNIDLLVGGQLWQDYGRSRVQVYGIAPNQTSKHVRYTQHAAYTQGTWATDLGKFTGGARYENGDRYNSSFVPRLGWTRNMGNWHSKILYSQAYRSPSIGNTSDSYVYGGGASVDLVPERTSIFEIETGYRINDKQAITLNLFDITVNHPIIYSGTTFTYNNADETGSRGFEVEYRLNVQKHQLVLTWDYYTAGGHRRPAKYAVEGEREELQAFAPHKVTASGIVQLSSNWRLSPSLIYLSKRYGPDDRNSDGVLEMAGFNPSYLANIFLSREDLLEIKGLSFGVGVFDMFQSNIEYPAAYDSGGQPLPGQSREYVMKLGYQATF